jgi:hypothetical protein
MYRLGIVLALLVPAAAADAGLMIELSGTPVALGGGRTRYNYEIDFSTLGAIERLEAGDFVTLYDVGTRLGSLEFAFAPASGLWDISINELGVNGPQTLPDDDPTLANVTWTYTGAPVSVSTAFTGMGVVTHTNGLRLDNYTSRRTDNAGPDAGTKIGEVGFAQVPVVPEPATLSILAVGAVALGSRRRRRSS